MIGMAGFGNNGQMSNAYENAMRQWSENEKAINSRKLGGNALVFQLLKKMGVDTNLMTEDEAFRKYNELLSQKQDAKIESGLPY